MKKKLTEINGREETYQPQTLAQIWGETGREKYGTLDLEEYRQQLESMTRSDMEEHARVVGIGIVDGKVRLRDNLIKEFKNHVAMARKPVEVKKVPSKPSAAALKVMSEGR